MRTRAGTARHVPLCGAFGRRLGVCLAGCLSRRCRRVCAARCAASRRRSRSSRSSRRSRTYRGASNTSKPFQTMGEICPVRQGKSSTGRTDRPGDNSPFSSSLSRMNTVSGPYRDIIAMLLHCAGKGLRDGPSCGILQTSQAGVARSTIEILPRTSTRRTFGPLVAQLRGGPIL
jgi:hypothetical protein